MEQQLRRPFLVTLVFLPVVLSAVHGVDVPSDGKDMGLLHEQMAAPAWTKQTRTSPARWSVTISKGGHGGHGHGHGHGNGGDRGHETPPVFNPRTIAGTTNYHHRRSAAPGSELGRPSTVVATCCVLLAAAIHL